MKRVTRSNWRAYSAQVIKKVLIDTRGQTDKQIRAALREAYPFGERAYHPYKIWLDEIARQRGFKPPLGTTVSEVDKDQTNLFI